MAKPPTKQSNQASHQIISAQWQGPLPHPEALSAFDRIIPNGAERIVRMVEEEQAHRITYEKTRLNALIADTRRGHYIGLALCVVAVAAATFTAYIGASWPVSVALVGVPVLGIIKTIVDSKSNTK